MTQDHLGPSFDSDPELGDAEPPLSSIAGKVPDSSCQECILSTAGTGDHSEEEQPSEGDGPITDNSASGDLSPLLPVADNGAVSGDENVSLVEEVSDVGVHIPDGGVLTPDQRMNLNNNRSNMNGHQHPYNIPLQPPAIIHDVAKTLDKKLAKELDLCGSRVDSNSDTSDPGSCSERESDHTDSSVTDFSALQTFQLADVPSAMVTNTSTVRLDIYMRLLEESKFCQVLPEQCTDHGPEVFPHMDYVVTLDPLPYQPFVDICTRKPEEQSSILVIGTKAAAIPLDVTTTAHPSPPEQKFNSPVGVGTCDLGIKIGCCAGLANAVLPSHDYQMASHWSYCNDIMEPTVRNFIESYGENNGID